MPPARDRIIDATLAIVEQKGFGGVTIAAVANDAGVSRQTVYSVFETRENLVSQAIGSVTRDALAGFRRRVGKADSATDYAVEFIVAARAVIRRHPVLMVLMRRNDSANPLYDRDMLARAAPVARELLAPMLELDPSLAARFDDVVELITRLGASAVFQASPATRTDANLRRLLRFWLEPVLESGARDTENERQDQIG